MNQVYQDPIRSLSTLDTLTQLHFPPELTVHNMPVCDGFQNLEVIYFMSIGRYPFYQHSNIH